MKKIRRHSFSGKSCSPEKWLSIQCGAPKHDEPYSTVENTEEMYKFLDNDQKKIVDVVMSKIIEWTTCRNSSEFEPLRMTIDGPSGTGKTTVSWLIVNLIRNLFQDEGAAMISAPTASVAFHAGGETLHQLLECSELNRRYNPFSMDSSKRKVLQDRFKSLVCLVIDGRSMVSCEQLGNASQILNETIYSGLRPTDGFECLPALILVGDDYQMPCVGTHVFSNPKLHNFRDQSKSFGKNIFLQCTDVVMALHTNKRIRDQQSARMVEKLRMAKNLNPQEEQQLLRLHLESIKSNHGKEAIVEIQKNALYVYDYVHEKHIKDFEMMKLHCTPTNPAAICMSNIDGCKNRCHFHPPVPSRTIIAVGARVALTDANFTPKWGLFNNAMGIVREIVFRRGGNPNNGCLPVYVVVEFDNYRGPVWDVDNPNVSAQGKI